MQEDQRQSATWQRYEVKYLITEGQAAEIRRYCRDYLPPDPFAAGAPDNEYGVLSAYLDSPSRELLRHTLFKQMNRYKLRVRTYRDFNESAADLPAFYEIKRKVNGVVQKTRARVPAEIGESLLWSDNSLFAGQCMIDTTTCMNLNEFLQVRSRIGARPAVGVYYAREAYEGNSAERIRITMDRQLHYGLLAEPGNGQRDMWWPAHAGGVILEIKFTNTYPFWVRDMLRRVEILRRGVCKYVICSQAAGTSLANLPGSDGG